MEPTTRSPIAGCACMIRHSASDSVPGFCRMASGTPSLPMSCSSAIWATSITSSSPSAELLRDRGGDADDRLGVLGGVVLARLERREQRLAGDRLALQPGGAAAVELQLDLVGDDPREHLEHAGVAVGAARGGLAREAAEGAVDRAVAQPDRDADVGADPVGVDRVGGAGRGGDVGDHRPDRRRRASGRTACPRAGSASRARSRRTARSRRRARRSGTPRPPPP